MQRPFDGIDMNARRAECRTVSLEKFSMPESVFFPRSPRPRVRRRGVMTARERALLMSARIVSPLNVLVLAFSLSLLACSGATPGTIGAKLGQRTDGRLFVRGVPAGQGADQAGLVDDDEILAIDGRPVREMTEDDVRRAVRGDVGTSMTLRVDRGGVKRDVKVKRSPLALERK